MEKGEKKGGRKAVSSSSKAYHPITATRGGGEKNPETTGRSL